MARLITIVSASETHELSLEHCHHDGEPLPPTSAHKTLRLVNKALNHVATPHLFRRLSPPDFAFDVDSEGESVIEQLSRSPCAIHVRELRMRPSCQKVMIGGAELLQARIARYTSIFGQMSAALTSLHTLTLHSLHFESLRSSYAFTYYFPHLGVLRLYLSDLTGRDILHYNAPDWPVDHPVGTTLASLPEFIVILESDPGVKSARFERSLEDAFYNLGLVLPCCIGLHQNPHWTDMLPLVDFVSLLAKDAAGLRMSTCGEVILPDCTLSTFAGFHDNLRILQLQDIALRASFIKGLLSRNQALVMLVLQNVSLIDGTWDDVLRSTGGFHLMEPVFCFIQGLKYARKGDSSMWWVGGVAEGKLYNKRTADHKALKAFEDMLHQNKDQSLQNKDRIMQS